MTINEKHKPVDLLSDSIRETAIQLFSEHGIEAVSMHQIAKGAGIGQGTLYRRYANKGDLCMAIMTDHFDSFMEQIDHYLSGHAALSPEAKISGIMSRLLRFVETQYRCLGVMHAHSKIEKPRFDFYESKPYRFLLQTLSGLFQEAMAAGSIRRVDPIYTAHTFISVMAPHTFVHLTKSCGYTLEQLEQLFDETFIQPLFK